MQKSCYPEIVNNVPQCCELVRNHHSGWLCSVCVPHAVRQLLDGAAEFCARPRTVYTELLQPLSDLTGLRWASLWCAPVGHNGLEVMVHCQQQFLHSELKLV